MQSAGSWPTDYTSKLPCHVRPKFGFPHWASDVNLTTLPRKAHRLFSTMETPHVGHPEILSTFIIYFPYI